MWLLTIQVFLRDAEQVDVWISTQEAFIAGDDYGVSSTHYVRNGKLARHICTCIQIPDGAFVRGLVACYVLQAAFCS